MLGRIVNRLLGRCPPMDVPPPGFEQIDAALQAEDHGLAGKLLDALPAPARDTAKAHCLRGRLMSQLGQPAAAVESFEIALALDSGDLHALVGMGGLRRAAGAFREAAGYWGRAIELAPALPGLRYNLACALAEAGNGEAALAHAHTLLREEPDSPLAGLLIAQLCETGGDLPAAEAAYLAVAELAPDNIEAWAGLGRTRRDCARFAAAAAAFERAGPSYMLDVGLACFHQRRYAEGIAWFQRILERDPANPEARFAWANAEIADGDFHSGWRRYAARFDLGGRTWARPVAPAWQGEPMTGGTLLVDAEQGFGDSMFAARFLPAARARVARLVVRCAATLRPVFEHSGLADQIVEDGHPVSADAHAYMLSLPALLDIRRPQRAQAYVRPAPELVGQWRAALAGPGGPSVGLVWSGLASASQNRYRTFDPEPLVRRLAGRARLFSLQLPQAGVASCPVGVVDLAPRLSDFGQTAGALVALDLLVTTETSVAHLAGALGVKAVVLLPLTADWRWEVAAEQNPWYASLLTLRQHKPMDWDDAFEAIGRTVEELAPGR